MLPFLGKRWRSDSLTVFEDINIVNSSRVFPGGCQPTLQFLRHNLGFTS
jgi:hypothetical protein